MDSATVFLSPSMTLWTVAGVGLLVHLIFKQTETRRPFWLLILLLVIPTCLTSLYLPHTTSRNFLTAAVKVFSLFWSTLITSILIYRVSPWHPLAKYPGPLLCKLTKFHLACFCLGGKQYLYYSELHKKYGDVVRIGPNELSIRNVDSVDPLMGPHGFQKGPFWSGRLPEYEIVSFLDNHHHHDNNDAMEESYEAVQSLVCVVDKQERARRRRPWIRSFSTSALKSYESIVVKRTLQLVEVVSSMNLVDNAVDLKIWIDYFGYDAMTDISFGGGSEMMRDGDTLGILDALAHAQKDVTFLGHVPWLGAMILSYPNLIPAYKKFRAHAQERAMRRIKEGSPYKDLFYHWIEDCVSGYKPSIAEAISDSDLAIVAGSETTTCVIKNVLYFLMTNPTAYKRLRAEIDGLGDNIVDCAAQVRLPYLNAVIHEVLRLFPPILSGVQRAVEPGTGGRMAGPIFIPEGTSAFIHTYSIQRDPRYFSPLPTSFLPERWLPEEQRLALEPEIFNSHQTSFINNTAAFIPFSSGPANCPGQSLAWIEMRMVVTVMISRFDLELDTSCYDPKKWFEDISDYFNMGTGSLPTIVSPR